MNFSDYLKFFCSDFGQSDWCPTLLSDCCPAWFDWCPAWLDWCPAWFDWCPAWFNWCPAWFKGVPFWFPVSSKTGLSEGCSKGWRLEEDNFLLPGEEEGDERSVKETEFNSSCLIWWPENLEDPGDGGVWRASWWEPLLWASVSSSSVRVDKHRLLPGDDPRSSELLVEISEARGQSTVNSRFNSAWLDDSHMLSQTGTELVERLLSSWYDGRGSDIWWCSVDPRTWHPW